jgi:patatin-like phospholipase/acyl hydrolase
MPDNILSLEGGGTWAILQAMTLADLYGGDVRGRQILSNFNLVVANSGGSIVAAGLWADMTPKQIIEEFGQDAILKNVFTKLGRVVS